MDVLKQLQDRAKEMIKGASVRRGEAEGAVTVWPEGSGEISSTYVNVIGGSKDESVSSQWYLMKGREAMDTSCV